MKIENRALCSRRIERRAQAIEGNILSNNFWAKPVLSRADGFQALLVYALHAGKATKHNKCFCPRPLHPLSRPSPSALSLSLTPLREVLWLTLRPRPLNNRKP